MGEAPQNVCLVDEFVVRPEDQFGEDEDVMFLNNIDQRFGYYVRNLFFFPNSPGLEVLVDKLKSGLSKVLVPYSFWAGRLRVNDKNKLEIVCNNKGALLASAICNLAISDVTEADFDDFFPDPAANLETLEDLPLLIIQVTQMSCGGYAISDLKHHTLGEATSAINFLMNFASLCRGEGLLTVPNSDRTILKARDPPQPKFEHHEFGKQDKHSRYTITPESVLKAESLRRSVAAGSSKQRKKYSFSTERLQFIKQSASNSLDAAKCSTFEALAAHLWRSHTTALLQSSSDQKRTVRLRFLMDTRNILQPPLGAEFCGNAIYVPTVMATAEELLSESLGKTAQRVKQGKESITEEYIRSGIDFLEMHPDFWYHPDCETVINAWPRVMSLSTELDFGWGKPCRIEYPMHPGNKSIIFFPFSDQKSCLDVSVSLELDQFPKFEEMLLSL